VKILMLVLLLSTSAFAEGVKEDLKEISNKVEKRKGYCSPLDKMLKKCAAEDGETDKKILKKSHKKIKEVSKKVEKRKGYCSPLDKMAGKCGKKK
jgi:hypothetical protein